MFCVLYVDLSGSFTDTHMCTKHLSRIFTVVHFSKSSIINPFPLCRSSLSLFELAQASAKLKKKTPENHKTKHRTTSLNPYTYYHFLSLPTFKSQDPSKSFVYSRSPLPPFQFVQVTKIWLLHRPLQSTSTVFLQFNNSCDTVNLMVIFFFFKSHLI